MGSAGTTTRFFTIQAYRILVGLLGITGLTLQVLRDGLGTFTYYTVLSNLLVTVFVWILIAQGFKHKQLPTAVALMRLKGGVTMAILITFAVYHFLLSPLTEPEQYWSIRNFLVHYIVPLCFLLDTIVFDPRRSYRWFDPFSWTGVPLGYFVLAILNGFIFKIPVPGSPDTPFPYFFVNVTKYGWGGVLQYAIAIFLAYVAVGYVLLVVKRFCGSKQLP